MGRIERPGESHEGVGRKKKRENDESVHAAPEGATALLDHMRADEGTALF